MGLRFHFPEITDESPMTLRNKSFLLFGWHVGHLHTGM